VGSAASLVLSSSSSFLRLAGNAGSSSDSSRARRLSVSFSRFGLALQVGSASRAVSSSSSSPLSVVGSTPTDAIKGRRLSLSVSRSGRSFQIGSASRAVLSSSSSSLSVAGSAPSDTIKGRCLSLSFSRTGRLCQVVSAASLVFSSSSSSLSVAGSSPTEMSALFPLMLLRDRARRAPERGMGDAERPQSSGAVQIAQGRARSGRAAGACAHSVSRLSRLERLSTRARCCP
jgi:hypothetical protein